MFLNLFLLKFTLSFLMCECQSDNHFENKNSLQLDAEFYKELQFTGTSNFSDRAWNIYPSVVVVVEMKKPLLETTNRFLENKNTSLFQDKKILLATIGTKGLQDVFIHNNSSELLSTIQNLKPSVPNTFRLPTMHALIELLQKQDLKDESLILITMTTPSDEDFADVLKEKLLKTRCQFSVLWSGENENINQTRLRDLAMNTNGFFKPTNEEFNENKTSDNKYFEENIDTYSRKITFPKEQKDIPEGTPLSSRAANQKVWQKISVPLIVEVASGTSLEVRPGTPTQIPFSVKNNLNNPTHINFNAKFNGIIQNVQPPQAFLQPGGRVTVAVNLQPFTTVQSNAVGTLTIFALTANKVTPRSALIFLTPQTTTDKTEPKMNYKYDGDCSNYRDPQNCENGYWSLTATLHDEDSGLLKVISEPYGLFFKSEFVAGTKSPVTVYYSATCCQPNVQIWAEDLRGNFVKKSFDVFNQTLLAGEIASIVVGTLLLLLIIIAIIVAVIFIKKRNSRNMIIPRIQT